MWESHKTGPRIYDQVVAVLRDSSEQLWPAVQETLASLGLKPEDAAARKLAQRYAQIIDQLPDKAPAGRPTQAWGLRWIGPLLLDALRELQATPAARAQPGKPQKPDAAKDQLAAMRAAKAQRRPAQQP